MSNLSYEQALAAAKRGLLIARDGWNGAKMYVGVRYPEEGDLLVVPFLYIKDAQGRFCPWTPSPIDQFIDDWRSMDPKDVTC